MRSLTLSLALLSWPVAALAAAPVVKFTLPVENTTPSVFASLPWPNDLYFDQGRPSDGDGTLLNNGASIGLAADVLHANADAIEQALDTLDGFGTTSGIYFFFDGPIDPATLPASPRLAPTLADSVFCADAATGTPVPILLKADVDTRIANTLAILPVPGKPLAPGTTYACVIQTSVTNAMSEAAAASADWVSVRDGASANGDADAIYDPVVTLLGTKGVVAANIAGMTVFTTESTTTDVLKIRETVLPGLPMPTADFSSRPELVFAGDTALVALLGASGHDHVAAVATGYYGSPRFQTHDPDGDGPFGDLPLPPDFVVCANCERTDERFTRDGSGTPIVIDTPQIPFTVVVPKGTPPAAGWPVIIQQHGLGGQRDTVVGFGDADAARGFVSIGIDAVAHGYRYFDCKPSAVCSQDTTNNLGGTAVPDGIADGTLAGQSISFLTVNLGFFQAFHNFTGIRDNFRQTYVDLMSLVRLLHGHSIDSGLNTKIDDGNIFYMGHSLGGLMGSGFVPIEPDLRAALLNATGGGLTNELFLNSSIGAGAQTLVNAILGLDPTNVPDQFNLASNFTQSIIDPADGVNSASLLLDPADGSPRNVLQVEDFGDQVVPNQASEALAVAAGLQIFDPFVINLHHNPISLALTPTARSIKGNAHGGATAALLQNGPATHAQSIITTPGTITFVPEFAHVEDFVLNGQGFPTLERGIRVPNAGILGSVLDWFADIVANGTPGTFAFGGDPDFNPAENADIPSGASTTAFFARTPNAGGTVSLADTTPDVTVSFTANVVPSRVTAGRSILGTDARVADADIPPGSASNVGTLGFLPFFVTLQRAVPGTFSADVTIAYTETELQVAGIRPASADEAALVIAHFATGACTLGGADCSNDNDCGANGPCVGGGYTALPTTIDTSAHTAATTGVTSFSTFAVVHPAALAGGFVPALVPGGGGGKGDCRASWLVANPSNSLVHGGRDASALQSCHDGDVSCDADRAVDGVCTFRVGFCFQQANAGRSCTASRTSGYVVRRPSPRGPQSGRANGQALVDALVALGGSARKNVVTFTAALSASACSPLAEVAVPLRKGNPATLKVKGCALVGHKCRDSDKLRLRCLPPSVPSS
jgi:hypothetical protein